MNKWLTESKAFSMPNVKMKPLIFRISATFNISDINRPASLINVFLIRSD